MGYDYTPSKIWKKDETAALITLYESERCLYDSDDRDHYDTTKINDAYQRIRQVMLRIRPNCTVSHIKSRIKYLRSQYSAELLRKDLAIQSGLCTEETYKPALWCFGLLQFLDDYLIPVKQNATKGGRVEEEISKDTEPEDDFSKHLSKESGTESLNYKGNNESFGVADEINDLNEDIEDNRKKKRKLSNTVSQKELDIEENGSTYSSCEREDIFGQYVASEMKALRDNPVLYLQTKQAILEILTSANFELINPD